MIWLVLIPAFLAGSVGYAFWKRYTADFFECILAGFVCLVVASGIVHAF